MREKGKYETFIKEHTALTVLPFLPEIKLYQADSIVTLWNVTQAFEKDDRYPPPFWAFAWVGGIGLARYILDNPDVVRGLKILDFASGCGVSAIAAASAGAAKVWFCDIDPYARHATQLNAQANDVKLHDWGRVDLEKPVKGVDIIFAGDVCYEHLMGYRVVAWLRLCVEKGIKVIMADPGRAYVPKQDYKSLAQMTVPASLELEDSPSREVAVFQLTEID